MPIILEDLVAELNDATDEDPIRPHVMFLANGEMMPDFRIVFTDSNNEYEYSVETGEVEPVVVEQLASP